MMSAWPKNWKEFELASFASPPDPLFGKPQTDFTLFLFGECHAT
jgi:hypothetical protein